VLLVGTDQHRDRGAPAKRHPLDAVGQRGDLRGVVLVAQPGEVDDPARPVPVDDLLGVVDAVRRAVGRHVCRVGGVDAVARHRGDEELADLVLERHPAQRPGDPVTGPRAGRGRRWHGDQTGDQGEAGHEDEPNRSEPVRRTACPLVAAVEPGRAMTPVHHRAPGQVPLSPHDRAPQSLRSSPTGAGMPGAAAAAAFTPAGWSDRRWRPHSRWVTVDIRPLWRLASGYPLIAVIDLQDPRVRRRGRGARAGRVGRWHRTAVSVRRSDPHSGAGETMKKRTVVALLAGLFVIGLTAYPASAQIGWGWHTLAVGGFIDYQVNGKHQRHAVSSFSIPSAYYKLSGGTEEFGLRTAVSNRMEHDTDDHYKTGRRQFEGDLQIYPGISQQSVVQIFGGGTGGPILMIKAYGRDNGSLVVTRDTSRNLSTNGFAGGKIGIRLVHDVGAHKLSIFINGSQKWTGADAGTSYKGGYNIKYGLYGSLNSATHTV
jgi:hypothetical protein